MHLLPVPRYLPIERRPLTTPIRVEVVSFDFGNTLVRVDRAASRAVLEAIGHGATLDGQIARNGQYPHVVRSGFGV